MKLRDLAEHFNSALHHIYQEEEVQAIFLIILDHVLGYSRADYLLKKDEVLIPEVLMELENILKALERGKPVQYVLGETVFYGLTFKVNESVLIPRPETEELVEWILSDAGLMKEEFNNYSLIDFGTGSGCIAVSLKKHLPLMQVSAVDVSEAAVEIACCNSSVNEVNVNFVIGDALNYTSTDLFDVIVSNPPYITQDEKEEMHDNVLSHEPHLALFVTNERPLIFYEAIADFAKTNLKTGGSLYFEINEYLGKETVAMLEDKLFINIVLRKDMQGKDRMIRCRLT